MDLPNVVSEQDVDGSLLSYLQTAMFVCLKFIKVDVKCW